MRNRAESKVDFPLPVRPQIPTFCPGWMARESLLRTGWLVSLAYEAVMSRNSTAPRAGQFPGSGVSDWGLASSETVVSTNSLTRETACNDVSRSV